VPHLLEVVDAIDPDQRLDLGTDRGMLVLRIAAGERIAAQRRERCKVPAGGGAGLYMISVTRSGGIVV